jgi:hypothetical protein
MTRIPTPPYIGDEDMRELNIEPSASLVTTHPLRWTATEATALLIAMSSWLEKHDVEHHLDTDELYFIFEIDGYRIVYFAEKDAVRETYSRMRQHYQVADHFESYTAFLRRFVEMKQRDAWFVEHLNSITEREKQSSHLHTSMLGV